MSDYTPSTFRQGNALPPTVDQNKRATVDRESMLYSYANTVLQSYTGDIRHYVKKFGDYLVSKGSYVDLIKNEEIFFPIRYAAPNLAFSDNLGTLDAAEEASIKDRIVLPVISYYLKSMEYDSKRAIDPCVRFRVKPAKAEPYSKAQVAPAPKPMKYVFQVDVWTETREAYYQILTAFQLDFQPYSYLTDLFDFDDETEKTFYTPYAKMTLDSFSDNSNYIPGTDRRVVRGTLSVTVEGWLTNPPKVVSTVHKVRSAVEGQVIQTPTGIRYASIQSSSNSPTIIENFSSGTEYITVEVPQVSPSETITLIDEDGIYTYIGEALPGSSETSPVWRIKRIHEPSPGDLQVLWATGVSSYTLVWANRTSYSYS